MSPTLPRLPRALGLAARPLPLPPLNLLLGRLTRRLSDAHPAMLRRLGDHAARRFLIDPLDLPWVLLLQPQDHLAVVGGVHLPFQHFAAGVQCLVVECGHGSDQSATADSGAQASAVLAASHIVPQNVGRSDLGIFFETSGDDVLVSLRPPAGRERAPLDGSFWIAIVAPDGKSPIFLYFFE